MSNPPFAQSLVSSLVESLAGSVAGAAGGYVTTAVDYDGSNDYASRGADLTAISDGKQLTFSLALRLDGGDGANQVPFAIRNGSGAAIGLQITRQNSNAMNVLGRNAAGTTILNANLTGTYTARAAFYAVIISVDLASGVFQAYIDDTDVSGSPSALSNDDLDFTAGNAGVGALSDGTFKTNGCVSELFFETSYIDLSVEGNRRKFFDADGRPVNKGADGSTPLGSQPLVYAPDGDPSDNKGSGGDFTITGALDVCSSSPSD